MHVVMYAGFFLVQRACPVCCGRRLVSIRCVTSLFPVAFVWLFDCDPMPPNKLMQMRPQFHAPSDTVYVQSDVGLEMYFIVSGRVDLWRNEESDADMQTERKADSSKVRGPPRIP